MSLAVSSQHSGYGMPQAFPLDHWSKLMIVLWNTVLMGARWCWDSIRGVGKTVAVHATHLCCLRAPADLETAGLDCCANCRESAGCEPSDATRDQHTYINVLALCMCLCCLVWYVDTQCIETSHLCVCQ